MGFSQNAFSAWEAWLKVPQSEKELNLYVFIQDEPLDLEHLHERACSSCKFESTWCGECPYPNASDAMEL